MQKSKIPVSSLTGINNSIRQLSYFHLTTHDNKQHAALITWLA